MTQEHAFKAAELCVRAELQAVDLTAESRTEAAEGR